MAAERTLERSWVHAAPDWTLKLSDRIAQSEASVADALSVADDRTLVEACLGGRREAFDVIVRRHQRQVYQICYRFVANHEDASDLAQDVFVRADRGLRGCEGEWAVGTWG